MTIAIPAAVRHVMEVLEAGGYEAYIVGGCVRDTLLGGTPDDWDVTTSARPEDTLRLFHACPGDKVIETGLRHGTVTVLSGGMPVEVTTYRIESGYSDNRHPDAVTFTTSLAEDLCRRDFTINAMAYSPSAGLVDLYSGVKDLENRVIRCVGVPDLRFHEDALRILRALRFSCVLAFSIDGETEGALRRCCDLLGHVAAERQQTELVKLLCGQDVLRVLMAYPEILARVIPELTSMVGFDQHNAYHAYDVYEHTARCVEAVPPRPVLRLAMLLHDIGKPSCFSMDDKGVGHFYGHQRISADMSREILTRLRFDSRTVETVCRLVLWHDVWIDPDEKAVKRWLNRLGEAECRMLVEIKKGDIRGQNPSLIDRLQDMDALSAVIDRVMASHACFTLKELAVNGDDLLALGIPAGKSMGELLHRLLLDVMDGNCPNEREALLMRAEELLAGTFQPEAGDTHGH